ncbi:RNA methyltransferase [Candidatus Poribacteria bacterium]|nr:RNA methyltransferase [Candidatus Poribacteria bacterium]
MRTSKSLQNKMKLVNVLHDKKLRMRENKVVLEGIRIIETALDSDVGFDFVLYSKNLFNNDRGKQILEKCSKNGIECMQIPENSIPAISQVETSQGIIAVVFKNEFEISQLQLSKKNIFLIILDSIQDPGNVGTIIRVAEASGADGVIVSKGCVDIYNPKAIRSSMGAIFQIPVIHVDNLKDTLKLLNNENIQIIATDVKAKKNYFEHQYSEKMAVLLGNEANGLKSELISQANVSIKIPILGKSESLNVATAASIIIYEKVRQKK